MTDRDKIDVIDYARERFDAQDKALGELKTLIMGLAKRVEDLETDREQRDGRDNFVAKAAKAIATTIVTAGAAIGAYLGLKS